MVKNVYVLLKLRLLRVLRGKNVFFQPQIFTDSHRSIKRAIKTNHDFGFLQGLHMLRGKKCFSVYIKLPALRALRGKNDFFI
ncbi:MAG: hypothetical protein HF981_11445 [Desulfobacteraceae bacterium]|nr:hypothetical protein [Desulfobacteraceae bacterium]MBC2750990.1 hypothetical protein [Desulfobacteraceae bacterium]